MCVRRLDEMIDSGCYLIKIGVFLKLCKQIIDSDEVLLLPGKIDHFRDNIRDATDRHFIASVSIGESKHVAGAIDSIMSLLGRARVSSPYPQKASWCIHKMLAMLHSDAKGYSPGCLGQNENGL